MNSEPTIKDIFQIVEFIRDNAVTADVFEKRLKELENKMITHIDGFVGLYQKQEVETCYLAHEMRTT